jgi:hypothetical protein
MRLSRNVRQVIGAAIGAGVAFALSMAFAIPAAERHEKMFDAPATEATLP